MGVVETNSKLANHSVTLYSMGFTSLIAGHMKQLINILRKVLLAIKVKE